MRATIDGIEIEGTPDEIAIVLSALRAGVRTEPRQPDSDGLRDADLAEGIPEGFAYRALRRIPLSAAQKGLLSALKKAYPRWVISSELQRILNCTPMQLGGIFGGLGRRVSATKGHEVGYNLWDWKWDDDEGQWAYRLPESVLAALTRAGV